MIRPDAYCTAPPDVSVPSLFESLLAQAASVAIADIIINDLKFFIAIVFRLDHII